MGWFEKFLRYGNVKIWKMILDFSKDAAGAGQSRTGKLALGPRFKRCLGIQHDLYYVL